MIDLAARYWRALPAILIAIAIAVVPGVARQAIAQDQVLLTDAQVTGFIASYPAIAALADEYDGQSAPAGDDVAASLGALATYQDAMGRLNETVGAHGFASYTEWMMVASAIMSAYSFAGEGGAMDEQMQTAIASIESNPNLSAEQKQMMLQQLQRAASSIAALRPPQENIDLVNAHSDELEAVLDL